MRIIKYALTTALTFGAFSLSSAAGPAQHGYSPLHKLKYSADFKHFDYVNPDAPKGGSIRIGRRGTYNSLNFLKYPGRTPATRNALPIALQAYLFDSLLTASADETAGYYGLLAKSVVVDRAFKQVKFIIRDEARWHDGKPVTAADVAFTFNTLKKQGAPFYRHSLRPVSVEAKGARTVIFTSRRPGNRELVQMVGLLPIHPKHYWEQNDVTKTTLKTPPGSGPYRVTKANAGKSLRLERVKTYWGANLAVNKGRYNFDQIDLSYYLDENSALTAFKAGDTDLRMEHSAIAWTSAYKGRSLKEGRLRKATFATGKPGQVVRLVFNVRRPVFKNRDVRQALAMLYDFPHLNKTMFYGAYQNADSVYGDTDLAAKGAAGEQEHALLKAHLEHLPKGILKTAAPKWRLKVLKERDALRQASRLLDGAGYKLQDGKRLAPKSGKPLVLSVAFTNPRHQRILSQYAAKLKRIGVLLDITALDPLAASQKLLNHDYDLAIIRSLPELVAGPRESLLWGSMHAMRKKSYAFGGVQDPALDHAIRSMRQARSLDAMHTAARTFDRILRWQVYDVLLWRKSDTWIAHWDKFGKPATEPKYEVTFADRWWMKTKAVRQSRK